jgi:hypothetical protein
VNAANTGSLVCVGVGMMLGAHLGPLARSHIEQAEVVFAAVSDALVERWLGGMNADVRSLQPFYAEGSSRMRTYRAMVRAMLAEVRAGRRVCGAFYGHPGVFAWVPHEAIRVARAEGFFARMEPGISAEDCLYADVGIDPGRVGCQHFEATQFMLYRRRIDTAAWLVLWQIGPAGDRTLTRSITGAAHREVLVEVLARDYPLEHEAIIYRAATLPIHRPRMERCRLVDLPGAQVSAEDTLAIPPCRALEIDKALAARLAVLDGAVR